MKSLGKQNPQPSLPQQEKREQILEGKETDVNAGRPSKQKRRCVVCGARVRNINPKVVTCSPDCTAKHHGRPAPDVRPVEVCKHCGKPCSDDEGIVCDECYSKYTPGMLADLEG